MYLAACMCSCAIIWIHYAVCVTPCTWSVLLWYLIAVCTPKDNGRDPFVVCSVRLVAQDWVIV